MSSEYRIISIGALATHPLWESQGDPRTPHATTSLITSEDRRLLVNPSLPPPILEARLLERTGLMLSQITDVFLTSFYPDHRRGLPGLEHATWFLSEPEQDAMTSFLATERFDAESHMDTERLALIQDEERLLDQVEIAPDSLMDGVDLFPLPGISPGCCGLLLPQSRQTVVFCGDAIPTIEHLEQGMVLPECWNREQAMNSFKEAIEISDVIVPGRDNVVIC